MCTEANLPRIDSLIYSHRLTKGCLLKKVLHVFSRSSISPRLFLRSSMSKRVFLRSSMSSILLRVFLKSEELKATAESHSGRLQWEATAGGHSGRLQREATAGGNNGNTTTLKQNAALPMLLLGNFTFRSSFQINLQTLTVHFIQKLYVCLPPYFQ